MIRRNARDRSTAPPVAVIQTEDGEHQLSDGDQVVIGRGSSAGLKVGIDPPDERVSREHARLEAAPGFVTVTRLSRNQLVVVRTTSSSFFLDAAGDSVRRGGVFSVLLPKTPQPGERPPTYHWIDVEVMALSTTGSGEPDGSRLTRPTMDLPQLSVRDLELLAAYAAPMITGIDTDRPMAATHQEVADRLHYAKEWCRERIDRLRKKLEIAGWPVGEDKDSLCRWAVACGLVGREGPADV